MTRQVAHPDRPFWVAVAKLTGVSRPPVPRPPDPPIDPVAALGLIAGRVDRQAANAITQAVVLEQIAADLRKVAVALEEHR